MNAYANKRFSILLVLAILMLAFASVVSAGNGNGNSCPDSAPANHFCSKNPNDKTWAQPHCNALEAHLSQGREVRFAEQCVAVATNEPTQAPTNTQVPPQPTATEEDKKVDICHFPPGNPENVQIINISVNAIDTHLDHGDHFDLGNCKPEPTATTVPPTDEPTTVPNTPVPPTDEPTTVPNTPVPPTDEPTTVPNTPVPPTDEPTTVPTDEPTPEETPEPEIELSCNRIDVQVVDNLTASAFIYASFSGIDGSGITYVISWGDGTVSSNQADRHIYDEAGEYTIGATVSYGQISSNCAAVLVTVVEEPPVHVECNPADEQLWITETFVSSSVDEEAGTITTTTETVSYDHVTGAECARDVDVKTDEIVTDTPVTTDDPTPAPTNPPVIEPTVCENQEDIFLVTAIGRYTNGVDLALLGADSFFVWQEQGNQYDGNVVTNCLGVNLQGREGEIHRFDFNGTGSAVIHKGENLFAQDIHSNGNGEIVFKDFDGNVIVTDGTFNVLTVVLEDTDENSKVFISPDGKVVATTKDTYVTFGIITEEGVVEVETTFRANDILGWSADGSAIRFRNKDLTVFYPLDGGQKVGQWNTRFDSVEETIEDFEIASTKNSVSYVQVEDGQLVVLGTLMPEDMFFNNAEYWTFKRPEHVDSASELAQ